MVSGLAPVVHACNPNFSGGIDQEDCGLSPPGKKQDPYLKKHTHKKRVIRVAQEVDCLPGKHEALSLKKKKVSEPGVSQVGKTGKKE
jgi:hypothetical protein